MMIMLIKRRRKNYWKSYWFSFFTIGQRKGLSIGGMKEPLFILATDTSNNLIYVGEGSDHPGLYRKSLKVYADNFHIVNPHYNILNLNKLKARIRYRQALQEVSIKADKDCFYFDFTKNQKPSRAVSLFLFTKVMN